MKWLVTGASGFVGRAMVARLARDAGNEVCAAIRRPGDPWPGGVVTPLVAELGPDTDWRAHLAGVDVVVHLAARVHARDDTQEEALAESRRVNVQGTQNLARQAAQAGVRRLVFASSVKVHGETTLPGVPFRADDTPHPQGAYGVSKHEAELALRVLAATTRMEVVVVRPPLVYGPGVQANFRALMHAVARGVPLPLGAVHNLRSFVALDNLVDLILVCARHPAAANQSFLVSDGCDLSTAGLLRHMGLALGRPARLWPVPLPLLQGLVRLAGRGDALQRLCGNLQVDISKTRDLLEWAPPVPVDEGMRRAASAYLAGRA